MISSQVIDNILENYVARFVPAMYKWHYHLILAKGGPNYLQLPEQSLFRHVINGIFGLARLLKFLSSEGSMPRQIDEPTIRKAFALYTIHDLHKLISKEERLGVSEFSIPLDRFLKEYQKLGLYEFADVDEHLMRAANVSRRSPKQGDLLLAEGQGSLLWLLVRLADSMASAQSLEEARSSLGTYLKSLGPAFAPIRPPGRYALYYHEIKDVRGMLTNLIHQIVSQQLEEKFGFFPLLYFATGTLYLGPSIIGNFDQALFLKDVTNDVLKTLTQYGLDISVAKDSLRRQKYDFQPYVYAFTDTQALLDIVLEETLLAKINHRTAEKEIRSIIAKRKQEDLPREWIEAKSKLEVSEPSLDWAAPVEKRLGISLLQPKEFNEHWARVYRYLLYVDTLLRNLNPAKARLEWFLRVFVIPKAVADSLRQEAEIWARGGLGKYVLVISYHFLKGQDFVDRSAESLPAEIVLDLLHKRVLKEMEQLDISAGRQAVIEDLGFQQDLITYLNENLMLSFTPEIQLTADILTEYVHRKRKGHSGKICSICNRSSPYVQELRTGILDDFGRVFSNRVLPAREAPGKNRLWCPICHLEFILRKMGGLSLPAGADYGNSKRIYLYVLPTFSFTPEHLMLFEPLLKQFHYVTNLPVRDYGSEAPGLPRLWIERREIDPTWVEDVLDILKRQAERIAEIGGRNYIGERVIMSDPSNQLNYYLITWEKAAREREQDDARIATRTEAWAKALFAAAVISGLTNCKVYVTERLYLPIADPAELKSTIVLDSPPPVLQGILDEQTNAVSLYGREKEGCSGLEQVLDLCSALWMITTEVRRIAFSKPTKDKQIAERLGMVNVEPLAGAHFYKEYSRLNEDRSPFETLARACEVLMEIKGGEMMDLVRQIAEKALEIRLPFRAYARGKTHSYELVFREGVDAICKAFEIIPELQRTALISGKPSEESIAELKEIAAGRLLKAMERRMTTGRGDGVINPWRGDLNALARELIGLLVDEVFLKRARGSFAHFLRLENSLADGIYYYTDRFIDQKWEEYKKAKAAHEAETNNSSEGG